MSLAGWLRCDGDHMGSNSGSQITGTQARQPKEGKTAEARIDFARVTARLNSRALIQKPHRGDGNGGGPSANTGRCGARGTPIRLGGSGAGVVVVGWGVEPGFDGVGDGFEVAAVVDFLDDGEAWELDEVDLAEREFEEDSADGSAVHDADLLPCCVDHDVRESLGLWINRLESP